MVTDSFVVKDSGTNVTCGRDVSESTLSFNAEKAGNPRPVENLKSKEADSFKVILSGIKVPDKRIVSMISKSGVMMVTMSVIDIPILVDAFVVRNSPSNVVGAEHLIVVG